MSFKAIWSGSWRERFRNPHFWFMVAVVAFVTVALVILRKMEHPWEGMTGKRIRDDRPWVEVDFGRFFGFWFGLGATILIALIGLSSGWWWKLAYPAGASRPVDRERFSRGAKVVLALILVFAGWVRGQHLDRFILRDEQDTLRYHLHGYHQQDRETGEIQFLATDWPDAAFGNRHGNNPVLMTVLSRASLEAWWKLTGAPRDRYSAVAIRLPGYLAGLASILVMAWCVAGFAPVRVALIAAAVAAIHSLHVDYSIQARGYAYVLLGTPLAFGGAIRALNGGRWRHWACLVGGSAISLYGYLGSLFFVGPFALAVFGVLFVRWRGLNGDLRSIADWKRDVTRLLVTGLIGVSIYLTFAVPPLMSFWVNREDFPGSIHMEWTWWMALWTDFAGGRIFKLPANGAGVIAPWPEVFREVVLSEPLVWLGMLAVVPVVVVGFREMWKHPRREVRWLFIVALLTPFVQTAVHRWVSHMVLFAFYLIYWLIPLIALFALGLDRLLTKTTDAIAGRKPSVSQAKIRAGLTGVSFLLLYWTAGVGSNPYLAIARPPETKPTVHLRSVFNWISYPDGRILKLDNVLPVPDTFPESLPPPPPLPKD
ncbi:MAG: hypothetical protein KDM63_01215 [Verrucomicrobiae bacterium]|nr:hypothetical protein [Verrucomicrobiae bacterium]